MKHLTALLLLAAPPATTEVAWPQHNVLTAHERGAGWVLLFDGKTTSGWRAPTGSKWTVADGMIAPQAGKQGLLVTTRKFRNYELKLQYLSKTYELPDSPKAKDERPQLLLACAPDGYFFPGKGAPLLLPGTMPLPRIITGEPSPLFTPNTGWVDLTVKVSEEGPDLAFEYSYRGRTTSGSAKQNNGNKAVEGHIALCGNGILFRNVKVRPR